MDPECQDHFGRCHLCKKLDVIWFCVECLHFFCYPCSERFAARTVAAILEKLFGRRPNCCGPIVALKG